MILVKLFSTFLKIGFLSFGGAYSFLPVFEKEVVEKCGWLTAQEFIDVMGIILVFPGALSIKYATYTGFKIAGIAGAVAANLGNMFPPVIIVIIASVFYFKHKENEWVKAAFSVVNIAVIAMIMAVSFKLILKTNILSVTGVIVFIVSAGLFYFSKIHPGFIILASATLGLFLKMMKIG